MPQRKRAGITEIHFNKELKEVRIMKNQEVFRLIDSYRDEFVSTLQRWVRQPSVKAEPAEGAPFGKDIRKMLNTHLHSSVGHILQKDRQHS